MGMSAADRLEKADALMAKSDEALRGGRPRSTPADARRKSMEKKKRRKPKWQGPGPGAYNVDDSKVSAPPSGLRLRLPAPSGLRLRLSAPVSVRSPSPLCLHSCQR